MNVILIISLFSIAFGAESGDWSYEGPRGPQNWPQFFQQCGGSKQSPININCENTERVKDFGCINFNDYYQLLRRLEIINPNGKTIELVPPNSVNITIRGGKLQGTYRLTQFHFHWGSENYQGSEHSFGEEPYFYPLEAHFVHSNVKYRTTEEALSNKDGLAVVAVFFRICVASSWGMERITRNIKSVLNANQTANFPFGLPLHDLLPINHCSYFRYHGSLTTPACNEVVTWTLIRHFACVTQEQLERFRRVRKTGPGVPSELIGNNFRPIQPLNGRIIKTNHRCN